MRTDKKNITIIILSVALIASVIGIYSKSFGTTCCLTPEEKIRLVIGTREGPSDLDPVRSWDSYSNDVIEQACEGLFQHNLSDPNLCIIPILAADYGSWDITGTHFTIPLRRNVWFHDGTLFNADAVKWNFERINFFLNATGMLNTSVGLSPIHSLWEFPNGTTILDPITPVTVNSAYSVTINLRAPYSILESLLCYVTAYMLSPSHTPKQRYIDTPDGVIVGTGPFVYDYYISHTEVKFHRWERYWRAGAFFEEIIYAIIEDSTRRYEVIKGHTVDYLIGSPPSFISANYSDPTLTYRSDIPSLSYYYLGMSNNKINQTWRQAISCAINYSYIIDELQRGTVYRSNGPLAPNFPMYDSTIQATTYNLTKAREIVVSMGYGNLSWTDAQWRAASFQSWNYSYNIGNAFREDLGVLLLDNLDLIGIDVIDAAPYCWDWPCPYPPEQPNFQETVQFYWMRWSSDILSPYDTIYSLFSNRTEFNLFQYHNHTVEMWLEEVLSETNQTKRSEIYSKILHQIVEIDMPHIFGYHPYQHTVHSADIRGVPYNALGSFYAYPIYRI